MKFGTDLGEYEKWYFKVCQLFLFLKLCHFKGFIDYVTLHNLSMLLTYIVTLYHMQWNY
jgi:hypothetical protein